jgi:protein-L-isoaspartate(D-aspartate) O-methyltransferase
MNPYSTWSMMNRDPANFDFHAGKGAGSGWLLCLGMLAVFGCDWAGQNGGDGASRVGDERRWAEARKLMVQRQLRGRDIMDERVLAAMEKVPRHLFVPPAQRDVAYVDSALPIGQGQTISQPYIVALMTELAQPGKQSRTLDVGTGSGYQAAVLAELVEHVYSIEIVEALAEESRERLERLGYKNVEVRHGDGYEGWPEQAPFDVIVVAAAPREIPQPLIDQLAPGGRLIIPVGDAWQHLLVVTKQEDGGIDTRHVAPVAFVPMTGKAEGEPRGRPRLDPAP